MPNRMIVRLLAGMTVACLGLVTTSPLSAQEIKLRVTLKSEADNTDSLTFSSDGKLLAAGSGFDGGRAILWDVTTGKEKANMNVSPSGDWVGSVGISGNGKVLAVGANAGGNRGHTVTLWDVDTGKEIAAFKGHTRRLQAVALSSDGKLLASGDHSKGGTVKLWDVDTAKEKATLKVIDLGSVQGSSIARLAFSGDGKVLLVVGNTTVSLWGLDTGKEKTTIKTGHDWQGGVVISGDGKLLASCQGDETVKLLDVNVKLWDVNTGKETTTLKHTRRVSSLAFSGDGKLLASGSQDGTIKLWDVTTGRELSSLKGHVGTVLSLTFSSDGRLLASGGASDGVESSTVKLWNIVGVKKADK